MVFRQQAPQQMYSGNQIQNYPNQTMAGSYVDWRGVPITQTQPSMSQMQQRSQMQQPSLSGKIVNALEEISAQDVPMDGSVGFFPVADGSAIYVKAWQSNGGIQTDRYVLDRPAEVTHQQPSEFDLVMQRLDRMEQMIQQYLQPGQKQEIKETVQNKTGSTKKGATE